MREEAEVNMPEGDVAPKEFRPLEELQRDWDDAVRVTLTRGNGRLSLVCGQGAREEVEGEEEEE